jgi:hypothetical protein
MVSQSEDEPMMMPTSGCGFAAGSGELAAGIETGPGTVVATALFGSGRFFAMRLVEHRSDPLEFVERLFYGVFQRAATRVRCFQ